MRLTSYTKPLKIMPLLSEIWAFQRIMLRDTFTPSTPQNGLRLFRCCRTHVYQQSRTDVGGGKRRSQGFTETLHKSKHIMQTSKQWFAPEAATVFAGVSRISHAMKGLFGRFVWKVKLLLTSLTSAQHQQCTLGKQNSLSNSTNVSGKTGLITGYFKWNKGL